MVIAVPTGIKIWATVRVFAELSLFNLFLFFNITNNVEEIVEDHSAYSDSVMIGGQQPALKRGMKAKTDVFINLYLYYWPKIALQIIGFLRMRLNYQNSSNFGYDPAFPRLQLLLGYLGSLKVKIYFKGYSIAKTLLIAFRTGYKRVSLFINSRVANATGEVSLICKNIFNTYYLRDGRGFVVPFVQSQFAQFGKEPKYLNKPYFGQKRSYTTRSSKNSLAPVQEQQEIPKGLQFLAKH